MRELFTVIIVAVGTCVISSCTYVDKDISQSAVYAKYIGKTVRLKYDYNLFESEYDKEHYRKHYITQSTIAGDHLVAKLRVGHPIYIEEVRLRDAGGVRSAIALGRVTVDGVIFEFEGTVAMFEGIGRQEPPWILP
jgi:hypothetical protein